MKYAFWRRPDGSLYKGNDNKFAPTALFAEIGETATVNPDNSISWPFSRLHEYQTAAFPAVAIVAPDEEELNEIDSSAIVSKSVNDAIRELGGRKPIQPGPLLQRINRAAASFYREPAIRRVFVTSISTKGLPLPLGGLDLKLQPVDRRVFPYPSALIEEKSFVTPHLSGTQYQSLAIPTEHASVYEAFERTTTKLNALRGIWNLFATFKSVSMGWSRVPRRTWIGVVHLGPVHSFHNEDGSLLGDTYWYEQDYVEDAKAFTPNKGWAKLEEDRKWACSRIEASPYQRDLIRLLARYSIALDQANLDVAFLMLWSLLEKITNTVGANYDETIDRAIWMYADRPIAKQLLQHMRLRRNRFVHSAGSSADRDQLCYITKSFVDGHLITLLRNDFKIESLKEYGEFLGMSHNPDRLRQLRDWYARAFEIQRPRIDDWSL